MNYEIDIFIRCALSQNLLPALINLYSSSPNIILNFFAMFFCVYKHISYPFYCFVEY